MKPAAFRKRLTEDFHDSLSDLGLVDIPCDKTPFPESFDMSDCTIGCTAPADFCQYRQTTIGRFGSEEDAGTLAVSPSPTLTDEEGSVNQPPKICSGSSLTSIGTGKNQVQSFMEQHALPQTQTLRQVSLMNEPLLTLEADVDFEARDPQPNTTVQALAPVSHAVAVPPQKVTSNHKPSNALISTPGEFDVMLGRGSRTNKNPGNVRYLQHKERIQPRYMMECMTSDDKCRMSYELMAFVHDAGGRFIKLAYPNLGVWKEVTNQEARRKCSQTLREINSAEERRKKREKYKKYPRNRKSKSANTRKQSASVAVKKGGLLSFGIQPVQIC